MSDFNFGDPMDERFVELRLKAQRLILRERHYAKLTVEVRPEDRPDVIEKWKYAFEAAKLALRDYYRAMNPGAPFPTDAEDWGDKVEFTTPAQENRVVIPFRRK